MQNKKTEFNHHNSIHHLVSALGWESICLPTSSDRVANKNITRFELSPKLPEMYFTGITLICSIIKLGYYCIILF